MSGSMRLLSVYDWSENFELASHPEVLGELVSNAGISPNKATFFLPEERKERRRTIFKNSKLVEVVSEFPRYGWVALDETVRGSFLNLRSHLTFDTVSNYKRYFVGRLAEEFSVIDAIGHLRCLCNYITPGYGFSQVEDGISAILFSSGTSTTEFTLDKSRRAKDLGDSLSETRRHLHGKLHDVYELNVLTSLHLESPVRGQTLRTWIEAGSRGELIQIHNAVFAWVVPENIRPDIRWVLFKEGALIATV
jgi:hypothetical protein